MPDFQRAFTLFITFGLIFSHIRMSKIKKSYCLRCDFDTNHEVLSHQSYRSPSDDHDYIINYFIVECRGCSRISFRDEFTDLENAYSTADGDMMHDVDIQTYPKKEKVQDKLEFSHVLPRRIRSIYKESIQAYNADCSILAGVAFRAVIEAICIEEKITGSNLEKKIDGLVRQKLITEKESKRLHSIRFIGNDSVHEMKIPSNASLKVVLNIVEHLLNNLYIIDYNSKDHLETIIENYSQFEELLSNESSLFQKGEEIPLSKLLGKNIRRLNGKFSEFETELKSRIISGDNVNLAIGRFDIYENNPKKQQHFIIT